MTPQLPRIAVIGAGLIGARHAQHAANLGCLAAVVDPSDVGKATALAQEVPYFQSIADMIKAGGIDGAIVATPTQYHAANVTELIEAKVPALIEKPITDSLDDGEHIVNLAETKQVPLLVGHHRRYNPLIAKAKHALDSGNIGKLVAVHAVCWLYKPDDYYTVEWRTKKGAGPLLTNLIHDIDLMRYFCGDVKRVQMMDSSNTRGHEVEDTAVLMLQFESGALASLSVSDTIVSPWSWEMTANENPAYPFTEQFCYHLGGTHGSLSIPDMQLWQHDSERGWYEPISNHTLKHSDEDPLQLQIKHFCNVISGIEQPLVSGREGLKTLQVLHAGWQAAQSGASVDL